MSFEKIENRQYILHTFLNHANILQQQKGQICVNLLLNVISFLFAH